MTARRTVLAFALACLLQGGAHAAETTIAASPSDWTQPANIGREELVATAYHDSGAYLHDLAEVDGEVADWISTRAPHVGKPALVLDIDETSLSNWTEMKANGFGFFTGGPCAVLPHGPCGFDAWERSEKAPALAPTLKLYNQARHLGVAVFFITGRSDDVVSETATNLQNAGYHDWAGLFLEPKGSHFASAVDYKAPTRAAIEAKGYDILATVGDQLSDLNGGHAERGFLLPNPFYFIP